MSHSIRRQSLLMVMMIVLLPAGSAFAQTQETGERNSQRYVNPTFGVTFAWGDSWERMNDQTVTFDDGEVFALTSIVTGARINVFINDSAGGRSAQSIADAYMHSIYAARTNVETLTPTANDAWNGKPAYFLTYNLEPGIPVDDYFEVRDVGAARLLIDVRGIQPSGYLVDDSAVGELTLDGDPLFAWIGEVTPLATYRSPTFGVTLAYDPAFWSLFDQREAVSNGGHDLLVLKSESMAAALNLETSTAYAGDMATCLNDAVTATVGDPARATPLLDANGNPIGDAYSDHAWIAFAFPSDNGDLTLNAFVECEALPDGAGSFVLTLIATEGDYAAAHNATLRILSSVNLEGAAEQLSEQTGQRPGRQDVPAGPRPTSTPANGNDSEAGDRSG